jgi:hypothetical protein
VLNTPPVVSPVVSPVVRGGIRTTIGSVDIEVCYNTLYELNGQTLTACAEDDDGDGRDYRPQKQHRPRYEEPIASRLRRELMVIGEAVSLDAAETIGDIAN